MVTLGPYLCDALSSSGFPAAYSSLLNGVRKGRWSKVLQVEMARGGYIVRFRISETVLPRLGEDCCGKRQKESASGEDK
jgi:hypothetical protein